jgi:hypothetical protein
MGVEVHNVGVVYRAVELDRVLVAGTEGIRRVHNTVDGDRDDVGFQILFHGRTARSARLCLDDFVVVEDHSQ